MSKKKEKEKLVKSKLRFSELNFNVLSNKTILPPVSFDD